MSSAFLYLAIVAIWAVFLVPAWLRRPHGQQQHEDDQTAGNAQAGDDAGRDDGREVAAANRAEPGPDEAADVGLARPGAGLASATRTDGGEARPAEHWRDPAPAWWREAVPVGPADSHERARMLKARRRILLTLVTLTIGAAAAAQGRFAGWWICIPPAGMLVLYLLLLREVAMADAEIARARVAAAQARTARRRAMTAAAAQAARAAPAAGAPDQGGGQRSATIIDISRRVGDQLYDQYADAAARAVGD